MNYRYRVKGRAEKAFILRGMHFCIGRQVDNYITDKELSFVKEHCSLTEIVDLQAIKTASQPIPTNSKNKDKGVENELQSKPTIRTNKSKPTSKV